jgi:hypothetical protein
MQVCLLSESDVCLVTHAGTAQRFDQRLCGLFIDRDSLVVSRQ